MHTPLAHEMAGPEEEERGTHTAVAAGACLYSAMLVVTLLRLLHHLAARPPSPFGTRKLFHVLLAAAYSRMVPPIPSHSIPHTDHDSSD